MQISNADQLLIDNYLRNKLSPREHAEFQDRLNHPEFQSALERTRDVQKAIKAQARQDFRSEIKGWDQQARGRILNMRRFLSIAASILLLVAVFFVFKQQPSNSDLFAQYFEPYPNVVAPLQKSGDSDLTTYERAFQLYESGAYEEATRALDGLDQDDMAVQFYHAVSLLALDKPAEALAELMRLAEVDGNAYEKPSEWFSSLALLKVGQENDARQILTGITADATHPYHRQARKLLLQMD